ncbi:hypothetical protein EVAR_39278_1 [Eumeta japonica]|uniref:Uncharacterized protein n=1 Tax=Eumeta variegata TaxID=151549 RepID=A0A4C1VWM6_EUMVA|nr:hypothetical protein EVAR_39278_1 [Eumeta japonica]
MEIDRDHKGQGKSKSFYLRLRSIPPHYDQLKQLFRLFLTSLRSLSLLGNPSRGCELVDGCSFTLEFGAPKGRAIAPKVSSPNLDWTSVKGLGSKAPQAKVKGKRQFISQQWGDKNLLCVTSRNNQKRLRTAAGPRKGRLFIIISVRCQTIHAVIGFGVTHVLCMKKSERRRRSRGSSPAALWEPEFQSSFLVYVPHRTPHPVSRTLLGTALWVLDSECMLVLGLEERGRLGRR